jgi:hypothetical protein
VGTPRASKCWYRLGSWILSSESMLSAGVIVAAVAKERSVGRLVVALITSPHSPSFLSSPLLFHSLPPLPFLLSLLPPSPYSPSFSLLSFLSSPSLTLPYFLSHSPVMCAGGLGKVAWNECPHHMSTDITVSNAASSSLPYSSTKGKHI